MRKEDFTQLIDRYLNGTATPTERSLVEEYYSRLTELEPVSREGNEDPESARKEVLVRIVESGLGPSVRRGRVFDRTWFRVAAAVLLLGAGIAIYFRMTRHENKDVVKVTTIPALQNDIAPGGNKAVLTLSNGKKIILDTAQNGAISEQGNSRVLKLADGQLAYNKNDSAPADVEISYNTLTTPRGGQYTLMLPDGTRVWLNASSSLTYPTNFTPEERKVEITGEAYFEVAKNSASPFVVKVKNAEVQVLGTSFNIMAYSDEAAVRTTLVEGAVKMSQGNSSLLLKPGEEGRLSPDGGIKLIRDADTEEAVAWKNNLFSFNDDDIHTVMRQIARWYDVDIVYEGKVPDHFNGNISRAVNVSEVFKMLQLTGRVHFHIEGKQIVVNP
ncbi:MAG: FecR domain-containing protein [Puia sp.]|nr:FecR domain-containing protein [Puia sp.]